LVASSLELVAALELTTSLELTVCEPGELAAFLAKSEVVLVGGRQVTAAAAAQTLLLAETSTVLD
jgi:hypothetical protein